MVDVRGKEVTDRVAVASGLVTMSAATTDLVMSRSLGKGDALEIARIAGIMAAKRTSELIPLCHPISIAAVEVSLESHPRGITIVATVKTAGRTGVEMEALTAVSVAALTLYDMVKGTEREAEIASVRLEEKSGGRSGLWRRPPD